MLRPWVRSAAFAVLAVVLGFVLVGALIAVVRFIDPTTPGSSVLDLVKAAFWPLVVVVVILEFRSPLSDLVDRIRSGSVEAGPAKLSFDTQQQIANDLDHARAARLSERQFAVEPGIVDPRARIGDAIAPRLWNPEPDIAVRQVRPSPDTISIVRDVTGPKTDGIYRNSSILWVDDNPHDNDFEAQALKKLGISIVQAVSTEEALARLETSTFDLVISNMKSGDRADAAATLIRELRSKGYLVPVYVYTGRTWMTSVNKDAAYQAGVAYITDDPKALFLAVTTYLISKKQIEIDAS